MCIRDSHCCGQSSLSTAVVSCHCVDSDHCPLLWSVVTVHCCGQWSVSTAVVSRHCPLVRSTCVAGHTAVVRTIWHLAASKYPYSEIRVLCFRAEQYYMEMLRVKDLQEESSDEPDELSQLLCHNNNNYYYFYYKR